MMGRRTPRLVAPCALLALVLPASAARAATIAIDTAPAPMTLTHAATGSTTSVVQISALLAWTLSIRDASATTPGRMDKVNCATHAALGGSLTNALGWSSPTGGRSGTLSGTDQTVATGVGLVVPQNVTVNYTQALTASDNVAAGTCYELTVTLTVV